MAGFNLADIMTQAAEFQTLLRGDTAKAKVSQEESQALRNEQINAADTMVKLSVEQARTEGEQKLETAKRAKATGEAFGVDILDPNNRIAYLASEQAAAVDSAIYNSKRAEALRDTSLFDSPLEYMMARPFADRNDQAAAEAAKRVTLIDKSIDDLNTQAQATVKTQASIQEAWTTEMQATALEQVALTAAQNVRQLKLNQNTAYITDLKTLQGMEADQIKVGVDSYKLVRHEQEFNARMEELAASREARKASAKGEKVALSEYMRMYNLGAKELGKQVFTDPVQFTALLKFNKDMVEAVVAKGSERGIDPMNPEAQTVPSYVARTPGESVFVLKQVGGTLPASAERTTAYLAEMNSSVQQRLVKEAGGKKITGDQVISGINGAVYGSQVEDAKGNKSKVAGTQAQMLANMEQDLQGGRIKNIYRAPDTATIAATTPSLTKELWWQAIVMPASLTSPTPAADQIMKQAQLAISNKSVTLEQAADGIATYYKAAILANNVNEQYQRVGLETPKNYPTVVSGGMDAWTSKGTGVQIDMIDPNQIKHRLMLNTMRIPGLIK